MSTSRGSFIFDVEGTLVDSAPQCIDCWQAVLNQNGHEISRETLQDFSGMDPADMLQTLLPEVEKSRRDEIIKDQGIVYKRDYLSTVRGLPGVRELLAGLKEQGHALALATTCDSSELNHYRSLMQVDDLIDQVACGDDVEHGKPHPDLFKLAMKRLGETVAVVVGDTPFDAMAAKRTNLSAIGLLTGGFARTRLLQAGCFAVFADPQDAGSSIGKLQFPEAFGSRD